MRDFLMSCGPYPISNEGKPILKVTLFQAELGLINDLGTSPRALGLNLSDRPGFRIDHDMVVIDSINVKTPQLKLRDNIEAPNSDLQKKTFTMTVGHIGQGLLKSQNTLFASRAGRFDAQATVTNSSKGPTAHSVVHGWNFTFDGTGQPLTSGENDRPNELERSALGLDESKAELRAMKGPIEITNFMNINWQSKLALFEILNALRRQ